MEKIFDYYFPEALHGKHIHRSERFDIHLYLDDSTLSVSLYLKQPANKLTGKIAKHQKRSSDAALTFRHGGFNYIGIDLVQNGPVPLNQGYGTLLGNIAFDIYQRYFSPPKDKFTFHNTMQTDDDIKNNSRRIQFYRRWGFEISTEKNGYYTLSAKLSDIKPTRKKETTKCGFPLMLPLSQFVDAEQIDFEIPEYSASAILQSELSVNSERIGFSRPIFEPENREYRCLQIQEDFVVLAGNGNNPKYGKRNDWILITQNQNNIITLSHDNFDSDYMISKGTDGEYFNKRERAIRSLQVKVIDRWDTISLQAEIDTRTFSNEEKQRLCHEVHCWRSQHYRHGVIKSIETIDGKQKESIPLSRTWNVDKNSYLSNQHKLREIRAQIFKQCLKADKRNARVRACKKYISLLIRWLIGYKERSFSKLKPSNR